MILVPAAAVGALAVTAALVLHPSSVGAGIQVGPVRVTEAAGTARHALVTVMDTGSGTETLAMLGACDASGGQIVPCGWVRRESVTVAAGSERTVVVTIAVPAGAAPGRYRRYVAASATPGTAAGLNAGADALTRLVVTVVPSATTHHATSANDRTQPQQTGA